MKLIVAAKTLKDATTKVGKVVASRTTIPILSHVLVTAHPAREATIAATNLDQYVSVDVTAEVEAVGGVALPAGLLRAFASAAPEGSDMRIEADETTATLSCGRRRAKVLVQPPDDFPAIAPPEGEPFFLDASAFAAVVHAVSSEPSRYYLCGPYLDFSEDDTLNIVATDGHRLGWRRLERPDGSDGAPSVILPREAVDLLAAMTGPVKVALDDRKIVAIGGRETMVSKLIDGTFPDWRRVVPTDPKMLFEVDRETLEAAVRGVMILKNEAGKPSVAVRITPADGEVCLEIAEDGNSASDIVKAEILGESHTFGCNGTYLASALAAFPEKAERVTVCQDSKVGPIKITSKAAPDIVQVIMPMGV